MSIELTDTIAAIASAPGPATRGIVRISGPDVATRLLADFRTADESRISESRTARRYPGQFHLRAIDELLDASVLLWPTNRSYTGQPMAELHTVGSPPILEAILAQLFENGVRPARNGEFTLRAFLSGRIDLVQAEAVLGVIDSTDQQQMERALRQLAGGVSGKLASTRVELISILGDLEAGLDFVEEDIEFIASAVLVRRLTLAIERLEALAASSDERMETRPFFTVALAGLPNAGKSTLFNALAESELAIVSEVAGTTRDYLTVDLDCAGMPVRLVDTAGAEADSTDIMEVAQQLRGQQVAEADLVVWCSATDMTNEEQVEDQRLREQLQTDSHAGVLFVRTKCDLDTGQQVQADVEVSAASGGGLPLLTEAIVAKLQDQGESELISSTGARCHQLLNSAIASMVAARDAGAAQLGDELVAIELRAALDSIGQILGTVYTDDILDHIFSNFCIGK